MTYDPVSPAGLRSLLRSRGYEEPDPVRLPGTIYALRRPRGYVLVVVVYDDGSRVVLGERRNGQRLWSVTFSRTTPEAVVLAALDAAEVAR
jgi:hypothetical protein